MSRRRGARWREPGSLPAPDFFDLEGSDPELLNSGRIPDPQPEHTPLFRWLARVCTAMEARLRARGDQNARFAIVFGWLLVAAIGAFLLLGPIVNKPLDFDEVIDSAKVSEVDWIATDARFDYVVSRGEDRGFAAAVSERYTASFTNGPERSIERKFVTEFRGHDTGFEVRSASIDGEPAEVDIDRGATVTTLVITRSDGAPLEGERQIALEYAMRDLVATEIDDATGQAVDRWAWPVLGPSWPQGTQGVEVSLTLPHDVDDALVRAPRAHVGWLLLSGTEWLTPEEETAGGVRYAFSNDDTLPPYPDLSITTSFDTGTFAQPPTTPLFWWQTWGPLLPLGVLVALLLLALAARRIVWADSAGDPWYLARSQPPELSPDEAAQLLDRPWHAELVSELVRGSAAAAPAKANAGWSARRAARKSRRAERAALKGREREDWLAAVARAGTRAGRIGNLPSVIRQRARWRRQDRPVQDGLRWVPDSYLRDSFLLGPIAVALLQWGLLRQLSHQVILAVVWWPALFVVVSTVLAIAIVGVVRRPRPLTRAGARIMQQLKGVDVTARSTRLLDRGPLDDPLLPYAVLFERARRAGRTVADHAGREAGDRALGRGWRTEHFVSLPAVLALAAAASLLAASIVTVSVRPAPYAEADFVTWPSSEFPGTIWSQVEGFEIEGHLQRDEHGGAVLRVVERDRVRFTPGGASVPQFEREWPRERLGQSLGLEIEAVRVDGAAVPFRTVAGPASTAMTTQLAGVLDGLSEVEIVYVLRSPVVDAPDPSNAQQLRWTSWYHFFRDTYELDARTLSGGNAPVRPLKLQLTVEPGIADRIVDGGWIDSDADRDRVPYESGNWYRPWHTESSFHPRSGVGERAAYDLRVGSQRTLDDGSLVVELDADAVESRRAQDPSAETPAGDWEVSDEINDQLDGHDLRLTDDLGVTLDFAAGTFSDVDPEAYERYRSAYQTPYIVVLGLAGLVGAASLGVLVLGVRSRRRASASLRVVAYGAIPLAATAQSVLFCWAVMSMPGGNAEGWAAILLGAVMLAAVTAQAVVVAKNAPARRDDARRGPPRKARQNESHD